MIVKPLIALHGEAGNRSINLDGDIFGAAGKVIGHIGSIADPVKTAEIF